jgi:hypothetical protein
MALGAGLQTNAQLIRFRPLVFPENAKSCLGPRGLVTKDPAIDIELLDRCL